MITGRPAVDTVEGKCPRRSSFGLRLPRRRRKLSQCFRSLSRFIQRSIVLRETRFCLSNLSQTMRPAICSSDQYVVMPSRTFPFISTRDIFVGKGRVTLRNRVLSWLGQQSIRIPMSCVVTLEKWCLGFDQVQLRSRYLRLWRTASEISFHVPEEMLKSTRRFSMSPYLKKSPGIGRFY